MALMPESDAGQPSGHRLAPLQAAFSGGLFLFVAHRRLSPRPSLLRLFDSTQTRLATLRVVVARLVAILSNANAGKHDGFCSSVGVADANHVRNDSGLSASCSQRWAADVEIPASLRVAAFNFPLLGS